MKLSWLFHIQWSKKKYQIVNDEGIRCDVRVFEIWRHNHLVCAKLGLTKILQETIIVTCKILAEYAILFSVLTVKWNFKKLV